MTTCCLPEALPHTTNQNLRINKMPYIKSSYSTKQPQHSQHCSQVRAWRWTSPHCASVTAETHSSGCTQLTQTSKQREVESLTTVWVVPHLEIVTSNFLSIVQNKMYKKTPQLRQTRARTVSVLFSLRFQSTLSISMRLAKQHIQNSSRRNEQTRYIHNNLQKAVKLYL